MVVGILGNMDKKTREIIAINENKNKGVIVNS